jgi:hypothetical protein
MVVALAAPIISNDNYKSLAYSGLMGGGYSCNTLIHT